MKIVVVGAGASGLMCAYKLKENGHDVILIDKNEKVGKKIYITGKGRCNLTNNCSNEEFFNNIVSNPKFLFSAYYNFNAQDTMEFFENQGVKLVTERGNRVFPESYKAGDIAQALYAANKNIGVTIKLNEKVTSIEHFEDSFLVRTNKGAYGTDRVVIATGGLSYSHTGSTGDGYTFAKMFGHEIIRTVPSLITLRIKEKIPQNLLRFTLKNVTLKMTGEGFKHEEFGEITFYKEGVAGAAALTTSAYINRFNKPLKLSIDFKPALSFEKLDDRLLRDMKDPKNLIVNDLIGKLLPREIRDWFVQLTHINLEDKLCDLTKEKRERIVQNIKDFELTYVGLDDIERATVTAGGVSVKEINPKTMESKLVPGLYFCGEVIDVDAFTGGFNLQIAFSTAALIAKNLY